MEQSDSPRRGKRFLRADLAVVVLIAVLACVGIALAVRDARATSRRTDLKNSLKQLGVYFALYESKYKTDHVDGDSLYRAMREWGSSPESLLTCRHCGGRIEFLGPPDAGGPFSGSEGAPPDIPLAWHRCPDEKPGDEVYVLYFQGRVDVLVAGSPSEQEIEKFRNPRPK